MTSLFEESPFKESPFKESPFEESPFEESPFKKSPFERPLIPMGKSSTRNTIDNLNKGLSKISAILISNKHLKSFNFKTGDIRIVYRDGNFCFEIITCNTPNASRIRINQYEILNEYADKNEFYSEDHYFHPHAFSSFVNKYLLTPDDLENQRAFEKQEQEREDMLKKAHYSSPRTCSGVFRCEYCNSEARHDQRKRGGGT